jgi:AcrR family transcriptional regulator
MGNVTVSGVVDRAETSVGSFYARFSSKEELIRYVRGQVWLEARERWERALTDRSWEGLSLPSVLEGVVGLVMQSYGEDLRRRQLLGPGAGADPLGSGEAAIFHDELLDSVRELLADHTGEMAHEDMEKAIRVGYRCVVGGIRETLERGELWGDGEAPVEGLASELARLWLAYLTTSAEDGGHTRTEGVDFFDPWG